MAVSHLTPGGALDLRQPKAVAIAPPLATDFEMQQMEVQFFMQAGNRVGAAATL